MLTALQAEAAALPAGVVTPKTLGQYLNGWLATATVRPSTYKTYEIAVRRQLIPMLGDVPLHELSPMHVKALVTELGRTMAPKSVRNVLGTLTAALTEAERLELVTRNVARRAKLPALQLRKIEALTPADAKAILAAAAGDRLEALYVLALGTGLRRSELLGLTWADYDRGAGTIEVSGTLARVGGAYVRSDLTKTRTSRRTIALPAFAIEALDRHRAAQDQERAAAGVQTLDGLIFVTPSGRPISEGTFTRHWQATFAKAGVPITFHGLRHGQASLLVAAGVHAKTISDRLGHADTGITMNRYAHTASASDRAAADLLDKAVTNG